ncbi:hypothetical protein ACR711_24260 [Klebsiella oxytoca]
MTSKSTITREGLEQLADNNTICKVSWDERIELAQIALAAMDSEPNRNPVLAYADSYRDMEKQGVESVPIWSVITDLERNIAPLYRHAQPITDASSEPLAYIFKHPAGRLFWALTDESNKGQSDVIPVYAAPQPAPVVMDESYQQLSELYHAQEKRLFKIAQRFKGPTFDKYSHLSSQAIDVLETAIFGEDDTCRAAMLQAGNSPAIPEGYVMVPMRLTAENGAKGVLSGEFSETQFVNCPECFGDDECETCDGSGIIEIKVPVSWTTIKEIWIKGVEYFAAAPQENN